MSGLLAAPRLESMPRVQRWMVRTMLVERLPLCGCGLWILLRPGNSPQLAVAGVLGLWVVYTMVNGWASTAWGTYVARALTAQERGRLHGYGNALGALSSLAIVPLVRASIERFGLAHGHEWQSHVLRQETGIHYLLTGHTHRRHDYRSQHIRQRIGCRVCSRLHGLHARIQRRASRPPLCPSMRSPLVTFTSSHTSFESAVPWVRMTSPWMLISTFSKPGRAGLIPAISM